MRTELISYKNSIKVKLAEQEKVASRAQDIIRKFKLTERLSEANIVAIKRAENQEIKAGEEIFLLKTSLDRINQGDLSEFTQLQNIDISNAAQVLRKESEMGKVKATAAIAKQKKKDKTYKNLKQERRKDRWDKKKFNIYYNKYLKAVDTLPSYMSENLENMPSNKGYLWRDCQFYGHQNPIRNEPLVLFERRRGVLWIHKYFEDRYEKHKKEGKGRESKSELVLRNVRKMKDRRIPPGGRTIEYAEADRSNNRRNNYRSNGRNRRTNSRNQRNHSNNRKSKRNLSSWK